MSVLLACKVMQCLHLATMSRLWGVPKVARQTGNELRTWSRSEIRLDVDSVEYQRRLITNIMIKKTFIHSDKKWCHLFWPFCCICLRSFIYFLVIHNRYEMKLFFFSILFSTEKKKKNRFFFFYQIGKFKKVSIPSNQNWKNSIRPSFDEGGVQGIPNFFG